MYTCVCLQALLYTYSNECIYMTRHDSLPGPEGLTHRGCATHTGFDHGCSGDRVIVLFVYDGKKRDQPSCSYGNNNNDNNISDRVCIIHIILYRRRVISRIYTVVICNS